MGTNYYLEQQLPCKCCQRPYERLHIGKSSAGWCFSLHVIPEQGLTDADSWFAACSQDGATIRSEYGEETTLSELIDIVCNRTWGKRGNLPLGYSSWADLYKENHAQEGPNGLLRSVVDGSHCIAHGDKTWDAITGEFT